MTETVDAAAKRIIDDVIDLQGADRTVRLDQACAGDPQLRRRVELLLTAMEKDDAFLKDPTISVASVPGSHAAAEGPGACIGPYKLLELIGQGGFGSVFMAQQAVPVRRRVALKIIKLGMDTRQVIARFEAERQALALMDHPNIAKVLDAGATDSGRPYFVMELVHGEPVTSYCDREKLSLPERLTLFRDICLAVQHAHQKGIIHRDLKPSNVLVTVADAKPIPKVIDFGIAKATATPLTDKTLFTEFRQLLGTPEYMSPEQAEPASTDIDTRSDIYSLGVLLYELLTGTTPFDGRELVASGYEGMRRILRDEEPPRPSLRFQTLAASSALVRLETPADTAVKSKASSAIDIARRRRLDPMPLTRALRGDLDWIVMKCLEKDRARRYETAAALSDDVWRYLDNEPVTACPPSLGYKLHKFVHRNRGTVLAATAIAAILLIAAGVSVAFGLSEARQRAIAENAKAQAQARADDLEKVAKFQQAQLSGIDAQAMGVRLRADLVEKARAKAERSKLPQDEVDRQIGELEKLIAGSDFTGMALESLKNNFFQPALSAIDKQFSNQPLVQAQLLQTSAFTMLKLGLLDAASVPQERALAIRRRELGDEHSDTLASIDSMGLLLTARGKLEQADPYLREALDKRRRVLGEEHPDTLTSLHNLALLRQDQGKREEAERYLREALDKRRRVLGDEHPDVLTSIGEMGVFLEAQGKLSEAEPYCREAIEKCRRNLGEDHRDTISAINNMGVLLHGLGKFAEAEQYWRKGLDGLRRLLGDEHPDTITEIHNLAFVLQSQGKLVEAEPYCREALERARRVLGEEHPQTLNSINSTAALLYSQGKYEEAEPYLREARETSRRVLGDDHPETLRTITSLASVLYAQGKFADAEGYFREVLEKNRRILGDKHPLTLTLINNMGTVLRAQGRLAEADPYCREALEKQRRLLGNEHPDTLLSINNIGALLLAQGKLAEAETYLREALETRRRLLGEEHTNTLISISDMGDLLQSQGKPREAIGLLASAEPAARRAFTGGKEVRLGRFLTALGRARVAVGEFDAANANLNEAHAILSEAKGATDRDRIESMTGLVALYDARHAAEPDKSYDAKAIEWRDRLKDLQASTQPAHQPP